MLVVSCLPNQKQLEQVSLDSPEILYLNHFNADDTSFWVGNDGMNYAELDEGYYYYESLDSSLRYNAPNFSIEEDQNFSVEISIINPTDEEDSLYYGLMVGEFSPQNYIVDFLINDLGQYKIETNIKVSSGNYKMGNTSEARKLKILKKDATTYFFINDNLVYNYVLDTLSQFRCGPTTSSAIWMDYIKIEKEGM
jgi:hypothetical protein